MYYLVTWRGYHGLEVQIAFRRRRLDQPYFPPDQFAMCTDDTAVQGRIFTSYITYHCCDDRPYNFYPLLDRIVAWMDEEYGDKRLLVEFESAIDLV